MDTKKVLHIIAFSLLIIGGINWGVIGFFGADYDLIDLLFGNINYVPDVLETLVGVSALYVLFTHRGDCKVCGGK
jgi:uncharacterized membrane protein YuzA (DUF378 family)